MAKAILSKFVSIAILTLLVLTLSACATGSDGTDAGTLPA